MLVQRCVKLTSVNTTEIQVTTYFYTLQRETLQLDKSEKYSILLELIHRAMKFWDTQISLLSQIIALVFSNKFPLIFTICTTNKQMTHIIWESFLETHKTTTNLFYMGSFHFNNVQYNLEIRVLEFQIDV